MEPLFDDLVFSNANYQNKNLVGQEILENPEAQGPCSFHQQSAFIFSSADTTVMLGSLMGQEIIKEFVENKHLTSHC